MTDDSRTADANDPNADPPPASAVPAERVASAARIASRLGRYQLVLPLAQGGMGVVFAARLLGGHGVERLVAIKTLRPITSKSDRTALLREAKLTARLHHRNVVATIDLGEVDDVPYVVMELVDGVPLSRLLSAVDKTDDKLSPELCAWIVMQAALGLHAAHELTDAQGKALGLVHRDVSPQNILLSLGGEVKIADFGIAKFAGRDETTATGMIKGKFAYMSPEQASDENVDRRSDVFALGIVLWEALTGAKLFSADTPARTIMRVLEHKPKSPHEVRPGVSEELSAITMRCLAKDPKDRYETAAALAEALRGALRARGEPIDEADLAKIVTAHFGKERAAFMDRVHNADPDALTRPSREPPLPGEASGLAAMSVSSGASAVARPSKSRGLVIGLVIAAGAAGLLVWKLSGDDGAKVAATGANASASASAPASASASATASASASATASASASASASATASAPASASVHPVHTARVAPPPPRSVPASAAPPPSAKPPPAPATGKPFDSL